MELVSFEATDWQIEEIKVEYYANYRQTLLKTEEMDGRVINNEAPGFSLQLWLKANLT